MKKSIFEPGVKEELLQRLNKLQEDTKPKWGIMTARQVTRHMTMAYQVQLGELPIPDRSNFMTRTVLRYFLLSGMVPSPEQAKKRPAQTQPELNVVERKIETGDLATEKTLLIKSMERFIALNDYPNRHFLIGRMKKKHWGYWAFSHMHYHLTQFGL